MSETAAVVNRKGRPARPPVPTVTDMDALDQTHAQVLAVLANLATLIEHLDRHGVDQTAREMAKAICTFFGTHARAHHADEERLVFPGLLASGDAELVQHVQRLQQDHGWLEEDWLEIEPQLSAVAEGYTWYDVDLLRHMLPVFESLYRDHIGLEESLIYPEARRRRAVEQVATAARTDHRA